jgi:hypothetical protein
VTRSSALPRMATRGSPTLTQTLTMPNVTSSGLMAMSRPLLAAALCSASPLLAASGAGGRGSVVTVADPAVGAPIFVPWSMINDDGG